MSGAKGAASGGAGNLYAAREPVFPKATKGFYRRLKWLIMLVTLGIYYVTPWIRWDRGPHQPDQAVLVDLANRRFYFFWIEIWPQEFYYVAGLLIMAGLGLFLVTSVLGRAWCGYTCPQTVWVDLFQHVERFVDGDRNAQWRLWNAPWTAHKIARRSVKWLIWLAISVATGGAWIFYFADAPTLARDFVTGEAAFVAYATVGILTATTFVFGGFMREQVCIYMCPWPRIQGAMLDENSLIVTYKDWRGEPRGKHRKSKDAEKLGDCIDCNACVAVCPTGVDIRKGQQIGCITCALCIDACDDIMAKVGKPRGLIDYCTLKDEELERAGNPPVAAWRRAVRPRTIIYSVLWSAIGIVMVVALFMRSEIDLAVHPVRNPVYVTLSDGTIRNAYDIKVQNMQGDPHRFRLSVRSPEANLGLALQGEESTVFDVAADEARRMRVFLDAVPTIPLPARVPVRFWVEDLETRERVHYDTTFRGPNTD
ncbi:cytochrome c oxidase accessory protein CcoG [Limibaculum sp. M0105]|uniref:Cytochrome c oxidase accessory protein CcoG n=1 Tax=Thermohalobaculum xanthum TaxID=2753746 RepID=A0A8J7M957_9RHOB|nr:cytochrome c oxidase accessory protein CcoG [Thermohalobaculum xanthum]MBK0400991.1 cytochrome c oxidase accessory protein CcoG [Thermohalobaculum xanthum]